MQTRRSFLKTSAALGAGTLILQAGIVRGQNTPNEKLNCAFFGAGGRAGANRAGAAGQNCYALCDTNRETLENVAKDYPDAIKTTDWRTLIDDPKIDVVFVTTAEHHHALASIAAMKAGKSVYTEKPLARTIQEARIMQDLYKERRGKIATQMGTQIHATENYRRAVEYVRAGAVGKIKEAHVWCSRTIRPIGPEFLPEQPIPAHIDWDVWLGPAPMRPFNIDYVNNGCLNWHRRWDFGTGVLGDMGSHLVDLAYWALELDRPYEVSCEAPEPDRLATPPWQIATWKHAPRKTCSEYTNGEIKLVWYHGPEGMKRRSDLLQPMVGDDTTINDWGIGVAFIGEKGLVVSDYGKVLLSPKSQFESYKIDPFIPSSLGHYEEFFVAAKGGPESLCNFDYSGRLIENNLLGNLAHRAGNVTLPWDPVKFTTGNADADKFLKSDYEYREGWDFVNK
ncbi:MAG: Gfo/Idh/MocA family oxidoreductase [Thermoguttaceae bacterium]|nr:Gfo/Idh/MocA family oxidoreductase [Thermoguttaceae bacterium]